jgi:hypothetical protein
VNPPPQVTTGQAAASYTPATLANSTTYFWQIVANNSGGSTAGAVWSFTTAAPVVPAPGAPASPSPTIGATGVSTTPTLTWTSANATSYDVKFGTVNPPPQVTTGQAAASYTPATLANSTTYFWQIVAKNGTGTTTGAVWSFTTAAPPASNIVIYAGDVDAATMNGLWTKTTDVSAAGGIKLLTPDNGESSLDSPLASPTHYFDVAFDAAAGTPYTIWLRLQALNNIKYNDAVWVQFSDARASGSPIYGLNTTSALMVNLATDSSATSLNRWGWQNGAYWLSQPTTLTFATSGPHKMRIQIREDGVQLDQIVLSPSTYLNASPGSLTNDSTIVPKP